MSEQDAPAIFAVDSSNLHQAEPIWRREEMKIVGQVAEAVEKSYPSLPVDIEKLLVEVTGFPGLSEINELHSSKAMGATQMKNFLPDDIVELLKTHGIHAESTLRTDFKPRDPKTQLILRQFIRHGEKYGPDYHRDTYSYQDSVFQYFVKKIK